MSNDRPQLDEESSLQTEEHKDQLADHVSKSFVPGDTALTGDQTTNEPAQETALEEERIKDEIEIQIDLLKDPDWAVRREAVITLGEMGDERCVEPLVKALQDGDWQVREVAIEALGMVGSPAVDPLIKLTRSWDHRKTVRPPSSRNPPNVSVYAVTIHCCVAVLIPSSSETVGRAMLTTVASRITSRTVSAMTARASQRFS